MYHAKIDYTATLNSYENGEIGDPVNFWQEEFMAETLKNLRAYVLEATFSTWEELDKEQFSDYIDCTKYDAMYLANESLEGKASASEIELYEKGLLDLYLIDCHIKVFESTYTKATL